MLLPSTDKLSRWTVQKVTDWLIESGLTVFRDYFLQESIDGNKLIQMTVHDVDRKYHAVPQRKRNILKEHLSKIEASRSTVSWTAKPPGLPPRPGVGSRPVPRLPSHNDSMSSDEDDWGDEFNDIDEGHAGGYVSDDDYLEPPKHNGQGHNFNGQHSDFDAPQSEYAIPDDDFDSRLHLPANPAKRTPSLVDSLREGLTIRRQSKVNRKEKNAAESDSDSDGDAYLEPLSGPPGDNVATPPARPPRPARLEKPNYINAPPETAAPPPRTPVIPTADPPDQTYEVMDNPSEVQNSKVTKYPELAASGGNDLSLPPRPEKPAQAGRRKHDSKPADSSSSQDDLSAYDWYHGKITRDFAENIFKRERRDGMFLIRKSQRTPEQPYTLVIWHINRIWNIPIRQLSDGHFAAGKFKPGETKFKEIVDLVEHFKVKPLSLRSEDKVTEAQYSLTTAAPKS